VDGDGSRGTALIWLVAAALAGIALLRLVGGGDDGGAPVRVERGGAAELADDDAPAGAAGSGKGAAGGIYVHVAGAVRRPGLIRVPAGARVAVALERAGGPRREAELSGVNLAARLDDGQQIVVPVRAGAAAGAPGAGGAGAVPGAPTAKPSVGAATAEQLDEIDGIGPTLAERIVEYRTQHGGFSSLEELGEVEGIGEKRLETLREALQP
jgi:competence protein ComEA